MGKDIKFVEIFPCKIHDGIKRFIETVSTICSGLNKESFCDIRKKPLSLQRITELSIFASISQCANSGGSKSVDLLSDS